MVSCVEPDELAELLEASMVLDLEKKANEAENARAKAENASTDAFYEAAQEAEDKQEALKTAIVEVSRKTAAPVAVVANALKSHLNEKDKKRVLDLLKAAQMVDIVFVLDATGSMWRIRDAVKNTIQQIIGEVQAMSAYLKFRLGAVAYRDVCDEGTAHGRFNIHQLNGSISGFVNFLDKLKVQGGGDACEDVIGGLQKALELDWKYSTKLVILCGDAPCHGTEYYDAKYRCRGGWDDYPNGEFAGSAPLAPVMRGLKEKGVEMTFLKINDSTDVMVGKMDEATGGGEFVMQSDLKIGIEGDSASPAETIAEVIKVSTKDSLMKSLSASRTAAESAGAKGPGRCKRAMTDLLGSVAEDEAPLPDGWEAARDGAGKEYFWNTTTKETTWERPGA